MISATLFIDDVDRMKHSYFSPMRLMAVEKSADEDNFDKMKAAYDACLDEEEIKRVGIEPLMNVLEEIKKVYSVSTPATSDSRALKDAILLLAKYGVSSLVSADTGADDTDPDTVVVSVSAPYSFGLPSKERYEDEKLVEKYRDVTIEVLNALYPNQNKDTFGKVIDLEKKLAAASPPSEERDDVTVCTKFHCITLISIVLFYNKYIVDWAQTALPELCLMSQHHAECFRLYDA
jgi:endothelin-converting enzyme